jgi:hypothetical protein
MTEKRKRPAAGEQSRTHQNFSQNQYSSFTSNGQARGDSTQLMRKAAVELLPLGFSVIPTKPDKKAAIPWKPFQEKGMSIPDVRKYFRNGCRIAVVCGKVSGNLECMDFDKPELFKPFLETLEGLNPALAVKLVARKTPSGGYHLIYRCKSAIGGNAKLAMSSDGKDTWIETRGEGGYFLTAPSPGYSVIRHSLKDTPIIIAEEVELLHSLAKSFTKKPEPAKQTRMATVNGTRPGDDYNRKNNTGDVARNYGWTETGISGPGGIHWTRPGKVQGTSATLKNGCLYVFSSSTPLPLGPNDAFSIYTYYEHDGDYSAAAKELAGQGYGKQSVPAAPKIEDWEELKPIKAELPPVEQIQDEMIPESFRAWVKDASDRMKVPEDFIIAPLLVVVGSVIGTGCRIRPKQKDNWEVTPNLWGGIIAPPSMLKSPALKEAVNKTLGRLEAEAKRQYKEKIQEYGANSSLLEIKLKVIDSEIKKAVGKTVTKPNNGEAEKEVSNYQKQKQTLALEQAQKPTERRFKTNDISIEKIVDLLTTNPRGLLYFRDELIGLFKRIEKPGHEGDRAFLLESWNGDGSHTDDRIGRGTIRADNVCISLLGGIPPDKIISYLRNAISEGNNDGFVQRLQLMIYPDPIAWNYIDRWPDNEAKKRAYEVIDELAWMDFNNIGETDEMDDSGPFLRFSDEAQEFFVEWFIWLHTVKLNNHDDHPVVQEHLAKYRSLMPSLALIFHLIDIADGQITGPVSIQAAKMGAAWCQYLESHARRIYSLALNSGNRAAARLAEKIKAGKLKDGFKRHDVVSKKWALLNDKRSVQEAIEYLIEAGWIKENFRESSSGTSGRPLAPIYMVNPKIFSETRLK